MLVVKDVLVSDELFREEFVCNLDSCKGECCVAGEAGAPVDEDEIKILEKILPKVKPYLNAEGKKAIAKQGTWVTDGPDEYATPLVKGAECAYVVFEKGIAKCGIEKAHADGKIEWKKPISCHLYPIRISRVGEMEALNYDRWDICNAACKFGKKLKVPVYRFLKEPLIRKYGEDFYEELDMIAHEYYREHGLDSLIDTSARPAGKSN